MTSSQELNSVTVKEQFLGKIINRVIGEIDSWGFKRWPIGWLRVRRTGMGWKTILGAALFYSDDVLRFAEQFSPRIASLFGMSDDGVILLRGVGSVLFAIGIADKYLKFNRPIERRQGRRVVTANSGAVFVLSPVSTDPKAIQQSVEPMSDVEKVVYDTAFAAAVSAGATLEVGKGKALGVVHAARGRVGAVVHSKEGK